MAKTRKTIVRLLMKSKEELQKLSWDVAYRLDDLYDCLSSVPYEVEENDIKSAIENLEKIFNETKKIASELKELE